VVTNISRIFSDVKDFWIKTCAPVKIAYISIISTIYNVFENHPPKYLLALEDTRLGYVCKSKLT
jgi:hypothetical protein